MHDKKDSGTLSAGPSGGQIQGNLRSHLRVGERTDSDVVSMDALHLITNISCGKIITLRDKSIKSTD